MGRAAIHSALADEHRLAIADALALGDRSPGDLAAELELSTNLVAHHLRVLEAAKVVRRRRSDGDGRRSYVQLRLTNPIVAATVAPGAIVAPARVEFVCTQNSARSQMAASAFAARTRFPVASAGTDPAPGVHALALRTIAKERLPRVGGAPAHVSDVVRAGDLVVAVCDNAYEDLATADPAPRLHWSIPDPARHDSRKPFRAALATMKPKIDRLAEAISQGEHP